jgi:protein subunit release factor A
MIDENNVILEIRAGTGGDEASLFAAEVFRMYTRFAEQHCWKVEVLSLSKSGVGGYKEVIAIIEGARVYSQIKWEGGVHRALRVPVTEMQGRMHTSAVKVDVLSKADKVDRSERIRTYNFPQNRLTDHRIGLTLHQIDLIMEGGLQPVVDALTAQYDLDLAHSQGEPCETSIGGRAFHRGMMHAHVS